MEDKTLNEKMELLDQKMDYVVKLLETLVGDADLSNSDERAKKSFEKQKEILGGFLKQSNMKGADEAMNMFESIMKSALGGK